MSLPYPYEAPSPHGVQMTAFVPMTPLLFRHLSGQSDPLAELRAEAVEAVRTACRGMEQVLVLCPVGGREAPGEWHDPSRARPVQGAPRSLAEQVGEHLLELAGVETPASYLECTDGEVDFAGLLDPRVTSALVVLGDGAAARSQAAPGHIDDRSFPYDDAVAAALAAGDATALAELAARPEAAELLVTGRHTWPVAARLRPRLTGPGGLVHCSDPFGLTYFVARW
ncbi:hypothetical protein GCM10011584_21510 [Nocardioides phosphati]|uniref:Catalytic LigB subunit of aromatic ring-opening dioxygenase n=1 Tax=Nocardioides phosphati TaxID=1867775 RepID=A0ABQ2NA51_9ACTN|nr:hypothetical protein [Nocardioides phosphati]GGO90215.1 hypothetical protein GCM10011584_21510 [Nocardioides phosphati]